MAVKSVNNEKAQQFLEFLSSIGNDRERYNAMVTVLLHAGRGSQTVDEFEMRTRLNMGTPAECLVSPNVSFDIFRDDYLRPFGHGQFMRGDLELHALGKHAGEAQADRERLRHGLRVSCRSFLSSDPTF